MRDLMIKLMMMMGVDFVILETVDSYDIRMVRKLRGRRYVIYLGRNVFLEGDGKVLGPRYIHSWEYL